ncbi:MAG TPA: thioredoxin family protein [Bacillus sp. (in: firmicutes)]|uniref:thioredoxin family protein n=1 Tax=Bacillus litorisediminis TaxID=2922713 RepID=UPI001FAC3050|nr:thioredoxin family protein [Bacillus litorisediminis]HWO77375.1 thioredoxin family protein [Bacillus sp. (in: firmicutes)]
MALEQWFDKGLTFEQYKELMKVNKENMLSILERFQLEKDDLKLIDQLKEKQLRAIVLTEDWCGDAMLNVPILMKIAERAKIDVRFLLRDQNLELMDQYLTNGTSRAIPIFIFIDNKGSEKAVWGPRAPKLQQLVDEVRAGLPDKEDPTFTEKQKESFRKLTKSYVEDAALWDEVSYSILTTLQDKVL